ncbi:MAG: aldehyde ferredoxin oxidoreductase C-terminal domain-containing protein [Acidobacteriota bacterium]
MSLQQILYVDLERRRVRRERLSPEDYRAVGGASLGVALLQRCLHVGPAPPHEAESPWILSIGPLTGTPFSKSAQAVVTHISPLTGGINDSVITHPLALTMAGTHTAAMVLSGRSEAPTWLHLSDGGVKFEDASQLWGMEVGPAARLLEEAAGGPGLVAGPAAEHGVPYASLGSPRHSAGRGGAGAALAAMNIKGLAGPARSPHQPPRPLNRQAAQHSTRGEKAVRRLRLLNERHALPTRNFRERSFSRVEELISDLSSRGKPPDLPYEAIFAFGPMLGVAQASIIRRAVAACDRLGLDVVSAGGTIAWALEAAEADLLKVPLPPSADTIEQLLECVARRDASVELLSLGSREGSRRLGPPADQWAMHVRGLELPGYDPRALPSMALGYAIGSRGACHVRSGAYEPDLQDPLIEPPQAQDLAYRAATYEDRSTLLDSLILSRNTRGNLGDPFEAAARLLAEAGDHDLADPEALRETTRKVASDRRRINRLRGWTGAGDRLPGRLLEQNCGVSTHLSSAGLRSWVSAYYRLRGWSAAGDPA